jgi:hypothetical protein
MTTYTATYNGNTYTRKTDRTYTHAVAVTNAEVKPWHNGKADGIVAWCGSAALAAKAAKKYSAPHFEFSKVQIVEVQK